MKKNNTDSVDYRIAIKFGCHPTSEEILRNIYLFSKSNEIEIQKDDNKVELKVQSENGFFEVLLLTQNMSSKLTKCKMYIIFTKPNEIDIVDDIISFLRELNTKIGITGVLDIDAGLLVDIFDYDDFKRRVRMKSEIFRARHPYIYPPIGYKELESLVRKGKKDKSCV